MFLPAPDSIPLFRARYFAFFVFSLLSFVPARRALRSFIGARRFFSRFLRAFGSVFLLIAFLAYSDFLYDLPPDFLRGRHVP